MLVARVKQTTPVSAPCAGCVEMGRAKIDATSNNVRAMSLFIERPLSFLAVGVYWFIEKEGGENVLFSRMLEGQH